MKKVTKYRIISITLFCLYLTYSLVFSNISSSLNLNNNISLFFISDVFFLILIVYVYRNKLKKDFNLLLKEKRFYAQRILKSFIFLLILLLLIAIVSSVLFYNNYKWNNNNYALYSLYKSDFIYFALKIFIFSILAEELLFRESVYLATRNDWVFLFVSSGIYLLFNFLFSNYENNFLFWNLIIIFIQAFAFSWVYLKNKKNIVAFFFIKLLYNIVPYLVLVMGVVN